MTRGDAQGPAADVRAGNWVAVLAPAALPGSTGADARAASAGCDRTSSGCAAARAGNSVNAVASPPSLVAPRSVGAQRSAPGRTVVDGSPALRTGEPFGGCSAVKAAALGAFLGAGIAYFFGPALGHNTRQHIMWGVGITAVMSGSVVFLEQVRCS